MNDTNAEQDNVLWEWNNFLEKKKKRTSWKRQNSKESQIFFFLINWTKGQPCLCTTRSIAICILGRWDTVAGHNLVVLHSNKKINYSSTTKTTQWTLYTKYKTVLSSVIGNENWHQETLETKEKRGGNASKLWIFFPLKPHQNVCNMRKSVDISMKLAQGKQRNSSTVLNFTEYYFTKSQFNRSNAPADYLSSYILLRIEDSLYETLLKDSQHWKFTSLVSLTTILW